MKNHFQVRRFAVRALLSFCLGTTAVRGETPDFQLHRWADAPSVTATPRSITPGRGPNAETDARVAQVADWLRATLKPDPRPVAQNGSSATARQLALETLANRVGPALLTRFRAENGTPRLIKGPVLEPKFNGTTKANSDPDEITARTFLRRNQSLLRIIDPDTEFTLVSSETDALGRRHIRFSQVFREHAVWPCELTVHLDPDGNVDSMDGAFVPTPEGVDQEPALSREQALQKARAWVAGGDTADVTDSALIIFAPLDLPPRLSWRCELSVDSERLWRIVIDAITGGVLQTVNRVQDAAITGSGVDGLRNRQVLGLWLQGSTFYMVDTRKSMFDRTSVPPFNARGAIQIYDARGAQTDDPAFTVGLVSSSSATSFWPPDAVDAAFGLSQTYDYFSARHSRNSLDGRGANIRAIVHYGDNVQNAFWNPGTKTMLFGAGFTRGLDVSGHELTHGVINSIGNGGILEYFGQPGALNESFADIFGEMVEAFTRDSQPDWLKGADLGFVLQNYADPGAVPFAPNRPNPVRMSQFVRPDDPVLDRFPHRDANGVHINSSIMNHCFYLLAVGMDGAIGLRDAERIFYRALTVHLQKQSQFIDARYACVAAAETLFGAASTQARATAGAFDAVEIFDAPGTPTPAPVPTVQAPDSTLSLRWDPIARQFFLVRRETALRDNETGFGLNTIKFVAPKRVAVTGDGATALYVTADNDLGIIETDGTNPRVAGISGLVHSLAVAPTGRRYAFVLLDSAGEPTNSVTVVDLETETERVIQLYAPGTEGARLDIIQFADTMDFSIDGQTLIYDAYSEINADNGTAFGGWTLYALDLQTDTIRALIDLNEGFDFGNPSLGNAHNHLVTFEVVDKATSVSTILAGDLFTGKASTIGIVNPAGSIGIPGYTGNDRAIVYANGDGSVNSGFSLFRQALADDGITAAGQPTLWLRDADIGVIYRRGDFVSANAPPAATITSPAPRQQFTPPATILIQATASDSDGSVAKVEFYAGSNKLGEDPTAPYSFTWTNPGTGEHRLIARAIDHIGASGDSSPVPVLVGSTPEPPLITGQPQPQTVSAGQSVSFTVIATGPAPLRYQWRKDGTDLAGATAASLTIQSAQARDAGGYSVVVSNTSGSVTSATALLTVDPDPSLNHPADTNPADFRIALGEMSAYSSAWKRGQSWPIDPNPIPQSFMVRAATLWKRGETYRHDPSTGGAPVWWVNTAVPGWQPLAAAPQSPNVTVLYQTDFESFAAGLAETLFGQGGWESTSGSGNGVVSGLFTTLGRTGFGKQAYVGFLPVGFGEPGLIAWRPFTFTKSASQTKVQFEVAMAILRSTNNRHDTFGWAAIGPSGTPLFTINFHTTNTAITYSLDDGRTLSASTGVTFTADRVENLAVEMDFARNKWSATHGTRSIVSDKAISTKAAPTGLTGIGASWALQTVNSAGNNFMAFDNYKITAEGVPVDPPMITRHPEGQSAIAGATVELSVEAAGSPPLTYQWRKDGSNLTGQTGSSLTLADAQPGDSGSYTVIVTNPAGSATSNPAVISVTPPESPQHPADRNPNDFRITIGEMSGYASAWKLGQTWPIEPNPIPQSYMVRAATLWKRGETYRHEPTAGTAPVWWVNAVQQQENGYSIRFAAPSQTGETVLYQTGFDAIDGYRERVAGGSGLAASLVGQNGWAGTITDGSGIDASIFTVLGRPELDQQAYLGFLPLVLGQTAAEVWQPIPFTPMNGQSTVRFTVLMALLRSQVGEHDAFGWRVANQEGNVLFAVEFFMPNRQIYIRLEDNAPAETGVTFSEGAIATFEITADFTNNLWHARYNGVSVTSDQPISNRSAPLNLGRVAGYWRLRTPGNPGNNFMAFDNYRIMALPANAQVPVINVQPQNQTVSVGTTLTLSVTVSGTEPLTYQWQKDNSDLQGETRSSLVLRNVQQSDAGSYSVVVSNDAGTVTSIPGTVTVTTKDNPTHPADNPADNRIALGEMSGYAAAWKQGQVWPTGPNPIPQSYMIRAATLWKRGETYTHDPTAGEPPVWWVNTDPQTELTLPSGFTTASAGNGTVVSTLPAAYIPGTAFTVSLQVNPTSGVTAFGVEDQPPADWTVSNISDDGAFDPVNRKVKWGPFFSNASKSLSYQLTPPSNASGPADFTGAGSFDGFDVAISGDRRISTDGGGGDRGTVVSTLPAAYVPGSAFTVSLQVNPTSSVTAFGVEDQPPAGWTVSNISDDGAFDPVNRKVKWGPFFSNASKTLSYQLTPPSNASGPADFTGAGSFDGFDVAISGDRRISTDGGGGDRGTVVSTLPAAYVPGSAFTVSLQVNPTSSVTAFGVEDQPPAGWTVSNISDDGAFDPVNRKVKWGPFFSNASKTLSYQLTPPSNASGPADFTGAGSFDGFDVAISGDRRISTDGGGGGGVAPTVTEHPVSLIVAAGATARFSVIAIGDVPFSYQWQRDDVDIPGATLAVFTIANAQPADAGVYRVRVANATGSTVSQPATLGVSSGDDAPMIVTQPQNRTVAEGGGATFTVVATGSPPLSFQWRLNRIPIDAATGSSLTLNNVQANDVGSYSVVVSNSLGAVISQSAMLTIEAPVIHFTVARMIPGRGFQFTLSGPPGQRYVIENSQDLKSWIEIVTLTNTTGTLQFTDTEALAIPAGYYRARVLPE